MLNAQNKIWNEKEMSEHWDRFKIGGLTLFVLIVAALLLNSFWALVWIKLIELEVDASIYLIAAALWLVSLAYVIGYVILVVMKKKFGMLG